MESQDRFLQNEVTGVTTIFALVLFLLLFLSFNTDAQLRTMVQDNSGVNILTLQSGSQIVSRVPLSSPETISENGSNENPSSAGDVRDLNWILKFSASGKVFKDISFADALYGYIVTELGSVYKSTDGGDTWLSVLNLGFPYYWYGVDALSRDTVIISGFNNQAAINQGVVRRQHMEPGYKFRHPGEWCRLAREGSLFQSGYRDRFQFFFRRMLVHNQWRKGFSFLDVYRH